MSDMTAPVTEPQINLTPAQLFEIIGRLQTEVMVLRGMLQAQGASATITTTTPVDKE